MFYRWTPVTRAHLPWWRRAICALLQRLVGGFGHCNVRIGTRIYDCDSDGCSSYGLGEYPFLPDESIPVSVADPVLDDWTRTARYHRWGTILSFLKVKHDNRTLVNCAACSARLVGVHPVPGTPNELFQRLRKDAEHESFQDAENQGPA